MILGEGCGGLDVGKCLESGTNSRRSADVWKIRHGNNVRKRISEIKEVIRIRHIGYCMIPNSNNTSMEPCVVVTSLVMAPL